MFKMTTKDLFIKNKQSCFVENNSQTGNQYSNLFLSKSYKSSTIIPIHSKSKSNNKKFNDSTISDNYEERRKLLPFQRSSRWSLKANNNVEEERDKQWKKDSTTTNKSILSLHISAYEKLVEATANDSFTFNNNEEKGIISDSIRKVTTASAFLVHNPFEFPRQQSDKLSNPEVSQFKASQRLFNSNQASNKQMSEFEEYNFDDDDDEDEEEFEKKIYIDDDDDDEEDEEEVDNEYEDKKQNFSQNPVASEEEEETLDSIVAEEEEEDVSDYEEEEEIQQPKTISTSKKRPPKKSVVETPKKKSRKTSLDSISKPVALETPIKMPTISETSSMAPPFSGIPTAQQNLKKKQIKQWCYICPLCSKTVYNKQTFERHLLLHDDFLTVLQVYYSEEDPVQCLNAAMEEWKVVETEYLKQNIEPLPLKQNSSKKDAILFKDKYYEYEAGKRMIFRQNAMDSLNTKKSNFSAEEWLKWKVFDEMQKIDKIKK